MNFFCTKKHYESWVKRMRVNRDEIFCLDAQEALVVARMLFEAEGKPGCRRSK